MKVHVLTALAIYYIYICVYEKKLFFQFTRTCQHDNFPTLQQKNTVANWLTGFITYHIISMSLWIPSSSILPQAAGFPSLIGLSLKLPTNSISLSPRLLVNVSTSSSVCFA